jgi:hypothetical protein
MEWSGYFFVIVYVLRGAVVYSVGYRRKKCDFPQIPADTVHGTGTYVTAQLARLYIM